MFQQYQPCCVRCHMCMAQHISFWLMLPLWNARKVSMNLTHLKLWDCSFLLIQPCWPKSRGFLSRRRFSPAQLILHLMCILGVSMLSQEGEKLCMWERMGCTGWCSWTVQPLWHPKRTDAHSSRRLVWCECSRPQCSLTATEYAQPCSMLLNPCKQHSLDGNGRYICLFSVGTE